MPEVLATYVAIRHCLCCLATYLASFPIQDGVRVTKANGFVIFIFLLTFRHQQKQHGSVLEETGDSSANDDRHSEDQKSKEDFKFNYHKAKMRFGLLLADIDDAIKEGDGERIRNL